MVQEQEVIPKKLKIFWQISWIFWQLQNIRHITEYYVMCQILRYVPNNIWPNTLPNIWPNTLAECFGRIHIWWNTTPVTYHLCRNIPAAFLQSWNSFIVDPCTPLLADDEASTPATTVFWHQQSSPNLSHLILSQRSTEYNCPQSCQVGLKVGGERRNYGAGQRYVTIR